MKRNPSSRAGRLLTGPRAGLVLLVAAGLTTAGGATVRAEAVSSNAADFTAVAQPSTRVVTLPTGEQVAVSGDSYQVVRKPAAAGALISYRDRATGDAYVIPSEAGPYVGRQLDRSLFDVTALARAAATAGRAQVKLTFSAGSTPQAPSGVVLTSTSGDTARGYLGTGTAFARALRMHLRDGRLPGGLASMSLAGASTTPTPAAKPSGARPLFADGILSIATRDMRGKPVTPLGFFLTNTDSIDRLPDSSSIVPVTDGVGRIAVPAGHYSATVVFTDYDADGNLTATRMVTVPDVTVQPGSTATKMTVKEKSADRPLSLKTPRPATPDNLDISMNRLDSTGRASGFNLTAEQVEPTYVNPVTAVTTGSLRYVARWGASPDNDASYRYDVAFGYNAIPRNEAFTVRTSQLATVRQRFSADPGEAPNGGLGVGIYDPLTQYPGGFIEQVASPAAPSDLTEYLGTGDGGRWFQEAASGATEFSTDVHTYRPGRTYTVDWAHGPLAPGFGTHSGPHAAVDRDQCAACVAGTTLGLTFNELDDSTADHVGKAADGATTHFALYRDGTLLGAADGATGGLVQGEQLTAATYRASLDVDLTHAGASRSTRSHTDLTFRYRPGSLPALPSEESCVDGTSDDPCHILPVLTLRYGLDTDELGVAAPGAQRMTLDIGHLTYDGAGSHARVTKAAVAVSFDGGTTFTPARLTGGNGHYVAHWTNPASAAGTSPVLRVTARDADGGTITQTIDNSYAISASAH